jgi:tryptophan-rich sensory protein
MGTQTNYIGGSAIRFSDLGTVALPLPADHGDVRQLVSDVHGSRAGKHHGEVGYITARGSFVNPREALLIARQARQLRSRIVRSEDLHVTNLLTPEARGETPLRARGGRASRPAANALVSRDQLRRDLLRTAEYAVPAALIVGAFSFHLASDFIYPAWTAMTGLAGFEWTALLAQLVISALGGFGLALVLHARGSRYRLAAATAFAGMLAFTCLCAAALGQGQLEIGMMLLGMTFPAALIATTLFGSIRVLAAVLLLPQIGWLLFLARAI